MIRHSYRRYDKELSKLFGKVGKQHGYELLKERINTAIYEKYPFLCS
jgi:hypothetical protein